MFANDQKHDYAASARIGVARRDVTPPVGIYNRAWGAAKHDIARGIHRPMTATAIAILPADTGGQAASGTGRERSSPGSQNPALKEGKSVDSNSQSDALVLVAVDAGWWQTVEDEWFVRGAVIERFGLDAARVMIAFSHTHAGPSLCRGDRDKPGGEMIDGYLTRFRDAIVEAVGEALGTARPATLNWAYGKCSLATNRDLPEPPGDSKEPPGSTRRLAGPGDSKEPPGLTRRLAARFVCGYNPDNAADDTLLVGRITDDATGRIFGTIVNYACHGTTLAWENELISPDFVGAMHEVVEANTGGVPCAFLQGASGELSPREQYVGDTGIADRNGRQLGWSVLATLESMLPPRTGLRYTGVVESGAPLATWAREPLEPSTVIAAEMIRVPLPLKPWKNEEEIQREVAACTDRVMGERLLRKLRVRQSVGTGSTSETCAWIWRIGDALLVGQPEEAYSAFQTALRQRFGEQAVVAMNLVNGCVGYLSPPEMHDLDIYQVWQSPYDRTALATLIDACADRMRAMVGRK